MNVVRICSLLCFLLLVSCGGGGGSTTGGPNGDQAATISGTVSLGILRNATVNLFLLAGDGSKISAGSTTTDNTGRYSVTLSKRPTTPLMVEVTGGTYLDEASGLPVTRSGNDILRAVVGSVGHNTSIAVTPLTDLAYKLAGTTTDPVAIDRANALVSDAFNFDIITTQPVEPSTMSPYDPDQVYQRGTTAQQNYTFALATLSQQAQDSQGTLATVMELYRAELSTTHVISVSTASAFTTAASHFLISARNLTGAHDLTSGIQSFGAMTHQVKLNTRGSFASGSFINGIQLQLQLPTGIMIQNGNGIPVPGVLVPSGVASSVTTYDAIYDQATRTISLALANGLEGFGLGEFITINCDVAPGAYLDASDFVVSVTKISGLGGDGTLTDFLTVFVSL